MLQCNMKIKPGDIVRRKSTLSRADDVPEDALGYVAWIDPPSGEAGRLQPRPVAVAWNDVGSTRRHYEHELELVNDNSVDEHLVLNVIKRLVERIERDRN